MSQLLAQHRTYLVFYID